jgi:hypothetical protein
MHAPPPSFSQVKKALSLLQPSSSAVSPGELEYWSGRVAELSEGGYWGALSLTARLMEQAQKRGEQSAWIAAADTIFFPPDLTWRGVDLAALTVIWPHERGSTLQAADWLVRSGAFALVVIDSFEERISDTELGRLGRLAEESYTAMVFLTHKRDDEPSLGTQVSLRVAVRACPEGAVAVTLKDKRGARSRFQWNCDGPMGLY